MNNNLCIVCNESVIWMRSGCPIVINDIKTIELFGNNNKWIHYKCLDEYDKIKESTINSH